MLIGLCSGFTGRAHGNLAKICIISTADDQRSNVTQCFFIILFVTHFNQLSHKTKREAKDFSALKRRKNTAGERASDNFFKDECHEISYSL